MARFLVVMTDAEEVQTAHCVVQTTGGANAITFHPWILQVYKDEWVLENIFVAGHTTATINNVFNKLGWMCVCVNLDELIMNDLNGGDSNSSNSRQEN